MATTSERYATILSRLAAGGAAFTIHEHAPSVTIQDADANLWFPVERLVKTIAFRIKDGGCVLAGLCGYDQVDYKKLAALCGVNRTKVMRLTPEQVEAELGYILGGVSPFAPDDRTTVVLDVGVTAWPTIYCGTGRPDRTLEIAPSELVKVAGAQVARLARASEPTKVNE